MIAIGVVTKLAGCGLPSMIFLKYKTKALRVGIGMISRGEVDLIVVGVGVSAGALTLDIYTTVLLPPLLHQSGSKGHIRENF